MAHTPTTQPSPTLSPGAALRLLRSFNEKGRPLASKRDLSHEEFYAWHSAAEHILIQAFGDNTPIVQNFRRIPPIYGIYDRGDGMMKRRESMAEAISALGTGIELLEAMGEPEHKHQQRSDRQMIFIGHGRSPAWRDLRDFLMNRLDLPVDEINRVAIAGATTVERLQEMLDAARFAFLVMTAEDEDSEGKHRARQNVIHEVGLFQGRLGFKKAIVLLEHDCEEFSNITGLSQIRFDKDNIGAKFEEIRRVLEREGLIPGTGASF